MRMLDRHRKLRIRARRLGLRSADSLAVFVDMFSKNNFDPNQPRGQRGRWVGPGGSVVTVEQRTRTGNTDVDDVTDQLVDILAKVMADRADGFGPLFGIGVHLDFANAVRAAHIETTGTIGVEQSFDGFGGVVSYGLDGSIRTDVTLHVGDDPDGPILAIWDVKTGGATLTQSRVDQIRAQLQLTPDVPIIQLHAVKGPLVKHLAIEISHAV